MTPDVNDCLICTVFVHSVPCYFHLVKEQLGLAAGSFESEQDQTSIENGQIHGTDVNNAEGIKVQFNLFGFKEKKDWRN